MTLDKKLLNIIVCPKCKGSVTFSELSNGLFCKNCRLLYEIIDGIPIMLIEKAKKQKDCQI